MALPSSIGKAPLIGPVIPGPLLELLSDHERLVTLIADMFVSRYLQRRSQGRKLQGWRYSLYS